MGAMNDANTRDLVIEYLEQIANGIAGEDTGAATNKDRMRRSLERIAGHFEETPFPKTVENQAASTADTVAKATADLNALITKLKDAGIMEGDAFTLAFATVTDSFAGHADRQYNTEKISSVAESEGVITITLSAKVSALKDFEAGNGWGNHKWLGIGIGAGINPITGLSYNGTALTAADVEEATTCGLSAGYFVRWVAADLVLAGDESQKSKGSFKLWASNYKETEYTLKIVEPS